MKIGVRLMLVISIFNLIGIGLLAGITLTLSQREIGRLAEEQVQSIARESGEKISNWFERHISVTRILAQIMEGYQDIPAEQRRDYFNMAMRQVLAANPRLLGVYANWAPMALDGLDAAYASTPGNDATGRFIPSWTMSNGAFQLSPILTFSWDLILNMPNTRMEYILEPAQYPYPLPEGRVLYANIGSPIKEKGTGALIGVAGATIVLSTIQSLVDEVKPFGDGHAFVFSPGGIVAAHPDPERLGKNMRESETDTFGPFLDTLVEAAAKGTSASFSYQSPQSDTVYQYYAVPFSVGNAPQPWTLVIGVSRNTVMAPV
ncbi:MAG: cache domain-containing protein, partial [Treponema sp.]|nr:cache domain-containing protein [Treponema sp.]